LLAFNDTHTCVSGDVGLSNLTDASFEPKPLMPEVVPVGGRLEIRCLLPKGVPTPVHRSALLFLYSMLYIGRTLIVVIYLYVRPSVRL